MPTVTVIIDNSLESFSVEKGSNLLEALKERDINIYGTLSSKLNCGGRGICATCGIYIIENTVVPKHWHDKLAHTFGYPRLSCQITIDEDIMIKKPDNKIIWGQLLPKFSR